MRRSTGELPKSRLDRGVRRFQGRNGLKADGLLNPAGPTVRALNRVLASAAPSQRTGGVAALKGLSAEAFSANGRLVRHLMGTGEDGLVPSLMADDFRLGIEGRAKTADFLGQLFKRDPSRARSLYAKAGAFA